MLPYQEEYVRNVQRIAELFGFTGSDAAGFAPWFQQRREAEGEMRTLRERNSELLNGFLFPALDALPAASKEEIADLEAFSDRLMDWQNNLDCGVYIAIHDALLSLYRIRQDREGVIRELYKLGMGLYYQGRMLTGIEDEAVDAVHFRNELVFTEAGSYIRYYEEIDDQPTRGYIIRALANIGLCARGYKRRIAVANRVLQITQDPHYRELAPTLPWDAFVRKTHQQMSSNRSNMARNDLTREEIAAVLDSCYEVFKPEEGVENPSIRWLWPYYEMEYNCGYADLKTTMDRLEALIRRTPEGQYDMSGLYGKVQLPMYYGRLIRRNPELKGDSRRMAFLAEAYRGALSTLLACPAERLDEYYFYQICWVVTEYYETEGVPSYRETMTRLMPRLSGELYISSLRKADMLRCCCEWLFAQDSAFFDDIPFLQTIGDDGEKKKALLEYAWRCGLFCDFGMLKMNITRILQTRKLFEGEYQMYQLHTLSGYQDLRKRGSTACFADVALGHHSWYNGAEGYPAGYARIASPYRQMTDAAAMVAYLAEEELPFAERIQAVFRQEGKRFSPLVTACLNDEALAARLEGILQDSGERYYRGVYDGLMGS